MTRVLVVGLDALSPELVERWLPDLPHLGQLMARGIYGPLHSVLQPVTPVAWPAMISGRDPSYLGYTDFVCRKAGSYADLQLVHARMIQIPTLATWLPAAERRVHMIGVPVSYPPEEIPGGVRLACFMAPSAQRPIVAPFALQAELLAQTSAPYILDAFVPDDAPTVDRDALLGQIRAMDQQRFDIARHLLGSTDWDLLFMVAMGTDRIGHYFMRFLDPQHGRYDPDPRYADAIRDHYRFCDQRLGELIALAGPETVVLVVSDHGIQRTDGRVNLNDWLAANGYLRLSAPLDRPTALSKAPIDWGQTRAWAQGYGGQIFLNLRGREPQGVVEPAAAAELLAELEAGLQTLTTAAGRRLPTTTVRRRQLYSGPQAERCPDLFVQFDELRHLSADQLGHRELVTPITTLGHDDASHANAGFLAMAGPGVPPQGRFSALSLLDVAPTILRLLDVPAPPDLEGRAIHVADETAIYSEEDEAELTNRLRALYLE